MENGKILLIKIALITILRLS